MSMIHEQKTTPEQKTATSIPGVPLTLEGASELHQMMQFDWAAWRKLSATEQCRLAQEAAEAFGAGTQGGPAAAALPALAGRVEYRAA